MLRDRQDTWIGIEVRRAATPGVGEHEAEGRETGHHILFLDLGAGYSCVFSWHKFTELYSICAHF